MNGRTLHDALLRVLTDAALRRAVLRADGLGSGGIGAEEAAVLRRSEPERIERMARFMARHFYRERVVRLFATTRALASRTGRDPLAALGTRAFREAIEGAVLGSPETAETVAALVEETLLRGDSDPRGNFPFWTDLVRYEGALFRVEAAPRTWRGGRESPTESTHPVRSPSSRVLELEWDLPPVLPLLQRGGTDSPIPPRTPTRLLVSCSPRGRVSVTRCPDSLLRLLEALDGKRTVPALAAALEVDETGVARTLSQLRDLGAVG